MRAELLPGLCAMGLASGVLLGGCVQTPAEDGLPGLESIAHGDQAWEERIVVAHYHLSRTDRSDGSAAGGSDSPSSSASWERRHRDFHFALLDGCGSSFLLRFCGQLYDHNIRYRHLSGHVAYPKRDIAEEHNAICDSVLARDADLAAELLIKHYQRTSKFLSDALNG